MNKPKKEKVIVLGLGFVGLPLAVLLASKGFKVIGVDSSLKVIEGLKKGVAHFYENGLQPLLTKNIGKNLEVQEKLDHHLGSIFIVAVGTSLREGNKIVDLSHIKGVCKDLGRVIKKGDLVILRSTMPIGATEKVAIPILEKESRLKPGYDFFVAFAPERVVEGSAIKELIKIPQIIGGINEKSVKKANDFFKKFVEKTVIVENLQTAELIKLVNNSYRDTTFGFANELAKICSEFNIDPHSVINAANEKYSRGFIPYPSPGVGGYCLTKDPYLLLGSAKSSRSNFSVIHHARKHNEAMPAHVIDIVLNFFSNIRREKIHGKKVALLGLAFKGWPETCDIRFSPSIEVASLLNKHGAKISGHDFFVTSDKLENYNQDVGFIKFHNEIPSALNGANVIIIMTNHPNYKSQDWLKHLILLKKPALFFDPWQLCDKNIIEQFEDVHYANLGYSTFNN